MTMATWKEIAYTDHTHESLAPSFPKWNIASNESVSVGDRQEYAIGTGTLVNQGVITLGDDSNLFVGV